MTDFTQFSKQQLGDAYKEIIGYDPFVDDPTNTVEEVVYQMKLYDIEAKKWNEQTFEKYFKTLI